MYSSDPRYSRMINAVAERALVCKSADSITPMVGVITEAFWDREGNGQGEYDCAGRDGDVWSDLVEVAKRKIAADYAENPDCIDDIRAEIESARWLIGDYDPKREDELSQAG